VQGVGSSLLILESKLLHNESLYNDILEMSQRNIEYVVSYLDKKPLDQTLKLAAKQVRDKLDKNPLSSLTFLEELQSSRHTDERLKKIIKDYHATKDSIAALQKRWKTESVVEETPAPAAIEPPDLKITIETDVSSATVEEILIAPESPASVVEGVSSTTTTASLEIPASPPLVASKPEPEIERVPEKPIAVDSVVPIQEAAVIEIEKEGDEPLALVSQIERHQVEPYFTAEFIEALRVFIGKIEGVARFSLSNIADLLRLINDNDSDRNHFIPKIRKFNEDIYFYLKSEQAFLLEDLDNILNLLTRSRIVTILSSRMKSFIEQNQGKIQLNLKTVKEVQKEVKEEEKNFEGMVKNLLLLEDSQPLKLEHPVSETDVEKIDKIPERIAVLKELHVEAQNCEGLPTGKLIDLRDQLSKSITFSKEFAPTLKHIGIKIDDRNAISEINVEISKYLKTRENVSESVQKMNPFRRWWYNLTATTVYSSQYNMRVEVSPQLKRIINTINQFKFNKKTIQGKKSKSKTEEEQFFMLMQNELSKGRGYPSEQVLFNQIASHISSRLMINRDIEISKKAAPINQIANHISSRLMINRDIEVSKKAAPKKVIKTHSKLKLAEIEAILEEEEIPKRRRQLKAIDGPTRRRSPLIQNHFLASQNKTTEVPVKEGYTVSFKPMKKDL